MRIQLAKAGKTKYRIVIGRAALSTELFAASELARYLQEISGATFPMVFDNAPVGEREIIVGVNERAAGMNTAYGEDEFEIIVKDERIYILGGGQRGTAYGVYDFLERELGCAWYTEDVSVIPKRGTVDIEVTERREKPAFSYREAFYTMQRDADWNFRNRLNTITNAIPFGDQHGKDARMTPGLVHTFRKFMPPEEYFGEHPEYFALVNGERRPDAQLCLSNPETLRVMKKRVMEHLRKKPDTKYLALSQNDGYDACRCPKCLAMDEAEGSPGGTLIRFINAIAEEVEKEFPKVSIVTLAYNYTIAPPKSIRPRSNVIIQICTMNVCPLHPLEDRCPMDYVLAKKYRVNEATMHPADAVIEWQKVTDRIFIWDYLTNFSNYLLPFPDFYSLQPNIRFFKRNHVEGIFNEGAIGEPSAYSEWHLLRRWLLAKLMWNPDFDVQKGIDDFLSGVYGRAAGAMRRYFDLTHEAALQGGVHSGIYDTPDQPFLPMDFVERANRMMDEAERMADDETILRRVRLVRLSVRYTELARAEVRDEAHCAAVDQFMADAREMGATMVREGDTLERVCDMLKTGEINELVPWVERE